MHLVEKLNGLFLSGMAMPPEPQPGLLIAEQQGSAIIAARPAGQASPPPGR